MKKLVVMMLIGAMVFSMTACGGGNADDSGAVESSTVQESSEANTQESTQESVQESSEAASDVQGEVTEGWSEEMTSLKEAVVAELGENYWPNMAIPADFLEGSYGLTPDMYVDYMGEMPMMSAHVDTLLIVKAAEGQEEAVEQALTAYRDNMVENSMQYPMNIGRVQASVVKRMDSYVVFALLGGDTMNAETQGGDEAVIKQCQEMNQKALDAIAAKLGVTE